MLLLLVLLFRMYVATGSRRWIYNFPPLVDKHVSISVLVNSAW